MRLLLTFIIFILGGFYTFGDNNCCEQCCEYLKNCCKKGKEEENKEENKKEEEEEVLEEFYLKKAKATDPEEIKKLVNEGWYIAKNGTASFILYEKINNIGDGGLNDNDIIKVKKDKNGFSIEGNFIPEKDNTKKWALFEIIYKEEKEEEKKGEEGKTVYLYCSDIESIKDNGIFEFCQQHVSISVIDCNTSKVTNMYSMFYKCSSLKELNLSNFNTEKVTNMSYMFSYCSSLTKLDLSNFNTDNVINMSDMFFGCSSLTELDLSKFNTEKVSDMGSMFSGCNSLQTVTFNNNLNEGMKQQFEILGLTEEVKEEENKITLGKKQ